MAKKKPQSQSAPQQKSPSAPRPPGSPLIDASLAASSVANLVAARSRHEGGPAGKAAPRESGAFKQLKDSLKPHSSLGIANSLNTALGTSKSNLPTHDKQTAHSQTIGNVNRISVPRRTAG
jgi:hypothetical protein